MLKAIKEDVKEWFLLFGLGVIFLVVFSKVWFLFWQFVAYLGGNI
jgi:hypothetical protein